MLRLNKTWVSLILTLLILVGLGIRPSGARAESFTDTQGHWAQGPINQLVGLKAVSGYPDNTFRPENTVTRAEFAAMLMKAFNFAPKASVVVFMDTYRHWAKDAISNATAYGIVSGYDQVTFGPQDPVTREQMAVMIVKACKLEGSYQGKTFPDQGSISAWAQDAVAAVTQKNIMGGYPNGSFQPQGRATRAEAATIISKALKEKR